MVQLVELEKDDILVFSNTDIIDDERTRADIAAWFGRMGVKVVVFAGAADISVVRKEAMKAWGDSNVVAGS